MKSILKSIAAFCLVFVMGAASDAPLAYLGDDCCMCNAQRIAALNDASRQLRDMIEDCDGEMQCEIDANEWHRQREQQIWQDYFWCVETCVPCFVDF